VAETFFAEMRRYVGFGAADEDALRELAAHARPHVSHLVDEFYRRLESHAGARAVFTGPAQLTRLKGTLHTWLEQLVVGPWDEAYFERRARIGHVHVKHALPQRYMFAAMDVIRVGLVAVVDESFGADVERRTRVASAVHRILDIELAIMLESFGMAFVEKVQRLERLEKTLLVEQLAVTEARYDEIVQKAGALITTADEQGRILLFNSLCEELTGLGRVEAVGRPWTEVFGAPPEPVGPGTQPYEGLVRTPAGAERRVRWRFTTLPGARAPVVCAIGIDVTEERALAERTRRAEHLAGLGTMAAGLAHEIRNPLNAAHLQLEVMKRKLVRPDPDGARAAAALVTSELARLASLVEEFLSFARPQPLRPAPLDLQATLATIAQLVAPEAAGAGVELEVIAPDPIEVEADEERIKQVVHNLVRNAIEATGRGGHVSIALVEREDTVDLLVEDDGPGLPPDAPIFEPFFTTKESGTGLGLAIVHRIVSDHGGRIAAESHPGRTVFTVSLPRKPA